MTRKIALGALLIAAITTAIMRIGRSKNASPEALTALPARATASPLPKRASPTAGNAAVPLSRATIQFRVMCSGGANPGFAADFAAWIIAPPALASAVQALDLTRRWSMDSSAAVDALTKMAAAEPRRSAKGAVTLRVMARGEAEAMEIADKLVEQLGAGLEDVESGRSSRIAPPVYRKIRELTGAVDKLRAELLDCMNRRGVVDYSFLNQLNGEPGVIHPDLDAALCPDVKLAWFSCQLADLRKLTPEETVAYLAGAVLPFEDPVMKQCRTWQDVAPVAASFEGTISPPGGGIPEWLESIRQETVAMTDLYKSSLEAWISETEAALPPSSPGSASTRFRQEEYRKLKEAYELRTEELKTMQSHAAALFGETPVYIPPVVILRRFVEPAAAPP